VVKEHKVAVAVILVHDDLWRFHMGYEQLTNVDKLGDNSRRSGAEQAESEAAIDYF